LARYGQHPKVISERLGHSSTEITNDIYTSVHPTQRQQVADQLDEAFMAASEASFAKGLQKAGQWPKATLLHLRKAV